MGESATVTTEMDDRVIVAASVTGHVSQWESYRMYGQAKVTYGPAENARTYSEYVLISVKR